MKTYTIQVMKVREDSDYYMGRVLELPDVAVYEANEREVLETLADVISSLDEMKINRR